MTEKTPPPFRRRYLILPTIGVSIFTIAMLMPGRDCSEHTAFYNAREEVRSEMRDPSSARFENETAVLVGECRYEVSGTVRGTNGFGGVTAEEFSVTVRG
ncbi:hypothetical protein [Maricaulis sp. MIT060901]|uniref:hypothetical protein n=1 Tax=Maricaulis sp. MIT060901 TaxID=3096993 RepID=UPI00399A5A15